MVIKYFQEFESRGQHNTEKSLREAGGKIMFTTRENNEKNGFGKGAQFSHSKCINVHMTENALLGLSIDCGSGFLKTSNKVVYHNIYKCVHSYISY